MMVRLGADEAGMEPVEAEEQRSSYLELKPSTTLLVPLELMEGQESLVGCSQLALHELHQTIVPDEPNSETHSDFSLILGVNEEDNEAADAKQMKNDVFFSDPPTLSLEAEAEASIEPLAKPEVILLEAEYQDALLFGGAYEEEQRKELLDGVNEDGTTLELDDLQTENTEENHEPEDAKEQGDTVSVGQDPAGLLVLEASPEGKFPAFVADSVQEEMGAEQDKTTTVEDQDKPEENGPVDIDTETGPSTEVDAVMQQQDLKIAVTEEENHDDARTESPRSLKVVEKEKPASNSQKEEQPESETHSIQREKVTPSTPTRRMTRAKAVTVISPVPEAVEEPQEDGKPMEPETSTVAPALPSCTPKKRQDKEVAVQTSTLRRSTRKVQKEPPKDESVEPAEAEDHSTTVRSTSKSSSPARRRVSQRALSNLFSGSAGQEAPTVAEDETTAGHEEGVANSKASRQTSAKTPTATKRRTAQSSSPRRSSRRTLSSHEDAPIPLEVLKEETEQVEVFTSPIKRTSRRTKTEPLEVQPALPEEEEDQKQQVSSHGRKTRQSSRHTLNAHPKVRIYYLL